MALVGQDSSTPRLSFFGELAPTGDLWIRWGTPVSVTALSTRRMPPIPSSVRQAVACRSWGS